VRRQARHDESLKQKPAIHTGVSPRNMWFCTIFTVPAPPPRPLAGAGSGIARNDNNSHRLNITTNAAKTLLDLMRIRNVRSEMLATANQDEIGLIENYKTNPIFLRDGVPSSLRLRAASIEKGLPVSASTAVVRVAAS
jgi:hypothetical protein